MIKFSANSASYQEFSNWNILTVARDTFWAITSISSPLCVWAIFEAGLIMDSLKIEKNCVGGTMSVKWFETSNGRKKEKKGISCILAKGLLKRERWQERLQSWPQLALKRASSFYLFLFLSPSLSLYSYVSILISVYNSIFLFQSIFLCLFLTISLLALWKWLHERVSVFSLLHENSETKAKSAMNCIALLEWNNNSSWYFRWCHPLFNAFPSRLFSSFCSLLWPATQNTAAPISRRQASSGGGPSRDYAYRETVLISIALCRLLWIIPLVAMLNWLPRVRELFHIAGFHFIRLFPLSLLLSQYFYSVIYTAVVPINSGKSRENSYIITFSFFLPSKV